MSSPFPVISSEVERSGSARLLPEGRKKSHEISPCASLSRDDMCSCSRDDMKNNVNPFVFHSTFRNFVRNRRISLYKGSLED